MPPITTKAVNREACVASRMPLSVFPFPFFQPENSCGSRERARYSPRNAQFTTSLPSAAASPKALDIFMVISIPIGGGENQNNLVALVRHMEMTMTDLGRVSEETKGNSFANMVEPTLFPPGYVQP